MRFVVQVDDPRSVVEEEHDVARILRDLVAVPIQRLRNAAGRAARVGLDVSGVDGIVETDPELLDLLSRPRAKRQLTVRRVGNAAWRTLLARAERAGMRIVRNDAQGVGDEVVDVERVP